MSRISPEKAEVLRSWLAEAGECAAEVEVTLVDEGVRHARVMAEVDGTPVAVEELLDVRL
ncbi:hypothetical protein AB0F91_00910 [Amycolatopsis sp. NPDC023774]|uniref:hypothetical protein n=1 Tax=Amycolatopsis sp. NPDC023774 TaxID=3155015 RepID=UPI0033C7A15C